MHSLSSRVLTDELDRNTRSFSEIPGALLSVSSLGVEEDSGIKLGGDTSNREGGESRGQRSDCKDERDDLHGYIFCFRMKL